MKEIVDAIKSKRFRFANEEELQAGIALCLGDRFGTVLKEHRFDGQNRIDFLLPDHRVGIECKIAGSPAEVLPQLMRYADREEIGTLILVTGRIQLSRSMPAIVRDKPLIVVPLWNNCF